jgi:hypothetical protein
MRSRWVKLRDPTTSDSQGSSVEQDEERVVEVWA